MEVETIIKKWGNSLGVIIPKQEINTHRLKQNQKVIISVKKKETTKVKDIFGMFPNTKEPIEKIMRDLDKELDSKFF